MTARVPRLPHVLTEGDRVVSDDGIKGTVRCVFPAFRDQPIRILVSWDTGRTLEEWADDMRFLGERHVPFQFGNFPSDKAANT